QQAASTNPQIMVGIYGNAVTFHPTTLLANSGIISYAMGVNTVNFSPRVYLSPGIYWLALSPTALLPNIYFLTTGGTTYGYAGSTTALPSDLSLSASTGSIAAAYQAQLDYCQ
ncbi:MAG TPA: hypothetical protein VFR02_05240, partial [bacterium]|nr:hypothetical protein [bacterium]